MKNALVIVDLLTEHVRLDVFECRATHVLDADATNLFSSMLILVSAFMPHWALCTCAASLETWVVSKPNTDTHK